MSRRCFPWRVTSSSRPAMSRRCFPWRVTSSSRPAMSRRCFPLASHFVIASSDVQTVLPTGESLRHRVERCPDGASPQTVLPPGESLGHHVERCQDGASHWRVTWSSRRAMSRRCFPRVSHFVIASSDVQTVLPPGASLGHRVQRCPYGASPWCVTWSSRPAMSRRCFPLVSHFVIASSDVQTVLPTGASLRHRVQRCPDGASHWRVTWSSRRAMSRRCFPLVSHFVITSSDVKTVLPPGESLRCHVQRCPDGASPWCVTSLSRPAMSRRCFPLVRHLVITSSDVKTVLPPGESLRCHVERCQDGASPWRVTSSSRRAMSKRHTAADLVTIRRSTTDNTTTN